MTLIGAAIRIVSTLAFVLGIVASPSVWSAAKILIFASDGAIAEYRLRFVPPESYEKETRAALAAGDAELARSLADLAKDQGVALPAELVDQVSALPSVDFGQVFKEIKGCVTAGDFESPGGFACVIAMDITVGDLRDVWLQGQAYLTGQPVDYLVLGAAIFGIGTSITTAGSGGAAIPLRVGASFIKGMAKLGKLPAKLVDEVSDALRRSIDGAALEEVVALAKALKVQELKRPLSKVVSPASLALVSNVAGDLGALNKAGGVRAMKAGIDFVETSADLKVVGKTASRFQGKFLGASKLLGKSMVRVADLLATLLGWLLAACVWLAGVLWFVFRLGLRLLHRLGGARKVQLPSTQ